MDVNIKDYPNREALRKAHDIYRDAMRSFIIRCLRKVRGEQVGDLIRDSLSYEEAEQFKEDLQEHNGNIEAAIDIKHFPHIIKKYWHRDRVFSQQFNSNSKVQYKTGTIADGRNLWAHPGVEDIDSERTRADLTYVAGVLGEINNRDAKREVEDIRDRLFSHEEEEHTADVSDQLEVVRAENTELKKQLNTTSSRLEEVETEWIASEEHLTDMSNLLKSVEVENADLKKRLLEKENRLKTVEMAGYAVECLLKTRLMHIYDCKNLRELEDLLRQRSILPANRTVFTHQLEDLLRLTPGYNRLMHNREMLPLFNKVNQWTPNWRYTSKSTHRREATEFITSIESFMQWVNNNL